MTVEIARTFERVGNIDFSRQINATQASDAWQAQRHTRITASAAAAVFPGVSSTVTTADLHRKLRGLPAKPFNDYALSAMSAGKQMEPILFSELASVMPRRVLITCSLFLSEDNLGATPDAIIVDGHVVVELKWRVGAEAAWNNELGHTVFCQVQLQMHVTGARSAYVYCGCASGERRLWLVLYSPSFMYVWTVWKNMAVALAEEHEARPRADNGTYDHCSLFIALEMKHHSAEVRLPQVPQILGQECRPVRSE